MKSFKGHFMVHQMEDPYISEVLSGESCPRRRSRLLVRYANVGCLLEKMGLTQMNNVVPLSRPDGTVAPVREPDSQSISSVLGEDFIANVLSDFMSPAPDDPIEKAREPNKGLEPE